jgi:phosphatidylserine/phosphatidylglycerophosphate/cardiolipin synthase-like enzyme
VLLWAGALVRVFPPAHAAVRRVREELIRGTRVQCALDSQERPMRCHHKKLVIVDGEVAFVGGIDLTSLASGSNKPAARVSDTTVAVERYVGRS